MDTQYGEILVKSAVDELENLKFSMTRAVEIINSDSGLAKYKELFCNEYDQIDKLLKLCDLDKKPRWDDIYEAFKDIKFDRLPTIGKDIEYDIKKQVNVKKIRDIEKGKLNEIREKIFNSNSRTIIEDMRGTYQKINCLANLVIGFTDKYEKRKKDKSLLDFNDLEHFCLEILTEEDETGIIRPSKTAIDLRKQFDEILVDEYQDTNEVQEIIINTISKVDENKHNVFMVGDLKQSIYRFRQARPELFMKKYTSFPSEKGSLTRKILLNKNFRSRSEIINAVNFVFSQIMSQHIGELEYTDNEELKYGANFPNNENENAISGGNVEIHLIETADIEEEKQYTSYLAGDQNEEQNSEQNEEDAEEQFVPDEEEFLSGKQCEARLIAKRINKMMNPDKDGKYYQIYDKSKKCYRKLMYRDIVILLRTVSGWSDVFMDEFTNAGVPTFTDIETGFLKNSEVQVILSLLRIIDNPLQDIPLLSVLRSPIVGLNTDELAEIRLSESNLSVYETLKIVSEDKGKSVSKKAVKFLADLKKWRESSVYMPADKLIWQLYNETGYYGTVGAMRQGDQRQANLRILFERAKKFEDTSYKGLFNFINFMDKVESGKSDMGNAKILGENDNVVRIMSVHKSKGLEFPVVFFGGCSKKFNMQDLNQSILLHQDLGFGPDIVDNNLRVSYPSTIKTTIKSIMRIETLSEEMRILYVAMTRAREKLIIVGAFDNVAKHAEKWAFIAGGTDKKIPPFNILKENSYIDWIGPALIRNKSCETMRERAGTDAEFSGIADDDYTKFDLYFWNKNELIGESKEFETRQADPESWLSEKGPENREEVIKEIDRRLKYEYIFKKLSEIPTKVSVTEMKKRFEAAEEDEVTAKIDYSVYKAKKPMFLEGKKGLTAAEMGTVIHFVMQHLEIKTADFKEQLDDMVRRELITFLQAETVDVKKIEKFFESGLGKRMKESKNVSREVPFMIEIPCTEIYKDMTDDIYEDESLLLQGVIDCYFEEADGVVLLDYKTDRIPDEGSEAIKRRYAIQIDYYAKAIKQLTGKKVINKYIYLFSTGEIIEYE